jgi:hypothetical protein
MPAGDIQTTVDERITAIAQMASGENRGALPLWEYMVLWLADFEWQVKAREAGLQSWELVSVIDGSTRRREDGPSGAASYSGTRSYWKRLLR